MGRGMHLNIGEILRATATLSVIERWELQCLILKSAGPCKLLLFECIILIQPGASLFTEPLAKGDWIC